MKYYMNYMDDAVVRVDDNGNRFAKIWDGSSHIVPTDEGFCPKGSKIAYGGESYGYFHILEPITKELYDTFGVSWGFGESGEIVPIEETQEYKLIQKHKANESK